MTVYPRAKLQQDTSQQVVFGALTVLPGGTITHTANSSTLSFLLNLNVTGDFDLQAGASIAVNATGYAGGAATKNGSGPGGGGYGVNGDGGGAGHGGLGGRGYTGAAGPANDDTVSPVDLGSRGGGNAGGKGGAGGGAALITVGGVFTVNGTINASGAGGTYGTDGAYAAGGGAGGTVNITATSFRGSGSIQANGGNGGTGNGGGGGGGRIAIVVSGTDSSNLNLQANGGNSGGSNGSTGGGAGTIALKTPGGTNYNLSIGDPTRLMVSSTPVAGPAPSFSTVTLGNSRVSFDPSSTVHIRSLVIIGIATVTANNMVFDSGALEVTAGGKLMLTANSVSGGSLIVDGGGLFQQMNASQLSFTSVNVSPGGVLTHAVNGSSITAALNLNVAGDFNLQAGATISVSGLGYAGGAAAKNGSGPGGGGYGVNGDGGGGGHGGLGGRGRSGAAGPANDDTSNPVDLGSGGGGHAGGKGGAGGGAALITVGGVLTVNGTINASGGGGAYGGDGAYAAGGGAGGTVNIAATSFSGSGSILANGGNGATGNGGGGGGGRIAIVVTGTDSSNLNLQANGGSGGGTNGSTGGGAGTIALKTPGGLNYNLSIGDLISVPASSTPIAGLDPSFSTVTLGNSRVSFDPSGTVHINSLVIAGKVTLTANNILFAENALMLVNSGAVLNLTANNVSFGGHSPFLISSAASVGATINAVSFGDDSSLIISSGAAMALTAGSFSFGARSPLLISSGASMSFTANNLSFGTNSSVEVQKGAILKLAGQSASGAALTVRSGGIFQQMNTSRLDFASVLVEPGGLLTHPANSSSHQYALNLGASGNFTLQAGATIAVDGLGYAGGLNANGSGPGGGVFASQGGGGGGGGHGGAGGSGTQGGSLGGAAYDSLTNPSDLGSGGSGSMQGGAGGGAVILQSGGAMRIDGLITANGVDGVSGGMYNGGGGGAGGAVNLRAATLMGTGAVKANGGSGGNGGYTGYSGGGGGGRIAILVDSSDDSSLSLSAGGGRGVSSGSRASASGGAGTISLKTSGGANYNLSIGDLTLVPGSSTPVAGSDPSFSTVTLNNSIVSFDPGSTVDINSLIIVGLATVTANNLVFGPDSPLLISSGAVLSLTANSLSFAGGAPVEVKGGAVFKLAAQSISGGALNVRGGGAFQQMNAARLDFVSVLVERGGLLTHASNSSSLLSLLNLNASNDFTLQAGATIAADGMGYAGGLNVNGSGPGGGVFASQGGGGEGGGHGGAGGYGTQGDGFGGAAYDSLSNPSDLGSGGSGSMQGGAGGGAVVLRSGGAMRIDGLISANGVDGVSGGMYNAGGGGSGGTVNLRAATLTGTGTVRANGGSGGNGGYTGYSGGGVGGRVALLVDSNDVSSLTLSAGGGSGISSGSRASASGGAGTVATRGPAASLYSLTLGGSAPLPQSPTPLSSDPPSFDAVVVIGTATVSAANPFVANSLEVRGGAFLRLDASLQSSQMTVRTGGTVAHSAGSAKGCDLSVSGTLTVEAGGLITADAAGFGPGQGPGAGYANTAGPYDNGNGGGGGGAYGGLGGRSDIFHTQSGALYGSFAWPGEFGSGGGPGNGNPGGSGGGIVKIKAGTLQLDGSISANGQNGVDYSGSSSFYAGGGGGSGGAIIVSATSLQGSGTIFAKGGIATSKDRIGGGGGGGRIALYYGTKSGSWTVSANGGTGRYTGNPGTILDNGVLAGLDVSASSGTLAAAQLTQTLQSEESLTETISAQTLDFSGIFSTGVPPGSFTSAQMNLVLVKTGAFVDRGFFRGPWTLALSSSVSLSGSWEGIASLASNEPRRLILKGALRGQVRASLDGTLTESSSGSGVFNVLSASCRVVTVDAALAANDMYVSGTGRLTGSTDYPGTRLSLLQTSLVGQLGGYYAGTADMTFTFLRVNSAGNPFQGEGFFHANYISPQGPGEGWAYAAAFDQAARLDGVFVSPLKGLAEGVLTLASPRALTLTLQNMDVGVALQPVLSLEISGPEQYLGWGSTVTMAVSLHNNGYAAASDMAVVAIFPEWTNFVSAAGNYLHYDVAHWRGSFYIAKPFVRWDFATVPARGVVKMYYQFYLRPQGASAPETGASLGGDVQAVPKAWADYVFAYYPPGGTQ